METYSLPALVPGSIMGAFDLQERWSDGENRNKKMFFFCHNPRNWVDKAWPRPALHVSCSKLELYN